MERLTKSAMVLAEIEKNKRLTYLDDVVTNMMALILKCSGVNMKKEKQQKQNTTQEVNRFLL